MGQGSSVDQALQQFGSQLQNISQRLPGTQQTSPGSPNQTDQGSSVQNGLRWNDVLDFGFQKSADREPIILFAKQPIPDPCALVGRGIITVANSLRSQGDGGVAFLLGSGPCPGCKTPTFYWYDNNQWANVGVNDSNALLRYVRSYVIPKQLNYIYHLYGDKDLNIVGVPNAVTFRDGQLLQDRACPEGRQNGQSTQTPNGTTAQQLAADAQANPRNGFQPAADTSMVSVMAGNEVVAKQLQETSSNNWIFWIIVVILLIIVIWLIYKNRKAIFGQMQKMGESTKAATQNAGRSLGGSRSGAVRA